MRVLHWTESFSPRIGGAEVFTGQLARGLQSRGHACLIITNWTTSLLPHEHVDGLEVYRFPFAIALADRDLRAIAGISAEIQSLARTWHPDLIHLHTAQPGAFFFLRLQHAAKFLSVYTTLDPLLEGTGKTPLWDQIAASVTGIAAVSEALREQVSRAAPDSRHKTRMIYNAVTFPELTPQPLDFQPPLLLFAGRLAPEKGLDVLLRSLPAVLSDFPAARLLVAGDGPLRPSLKSLCAELGIERSVSFLGWVSPERIPELINRCTLVVVPSRKETFGLIALQAMQMARPLVASRAGGLVELALDGQTGLLAPIEDVSATARAITSLLADPALAVRLGRQGRERARTLFSWERCLDEYEILYRQVLA